MISLIQSCGLFFLCLACLYANDHIVNPSFSNFDILHCDDNVKFLVFGCNNAMWLVILDYGCQSKKLRSS
jgi:hypothetical protein